MVATKPYDWTQFKQRIFVKADKERVFRAWTDDRIVSRWFTVKTMIEPRNNGRLYFEWLAGDKFEARIVSIRKPTRFVFPFGSRGEEVAVGIRKVRGGSVVELHQYNMKTSPRSKVEMHMNCKTGWAFFLTNLKAYLEHGIDLRGHNPRRSHRQGYINS